MLSCRCLIGSEVTNGFFRLSRSLEPGFFTTVADRPCPQSGFRHSIARDVRRERLSEPTRLHVRVRHLRRRARGAGLCHGQVFALGALHEGVVTRDQRTKNGKIPQHLLFPVRPPFDRGPCTYRAGHRAALDPGRHRRGGRAALGWAGTINALSGFFPS